MNEHLFTNNDGLRLITQFEGAPRLRARRCEGGAWELSYGVTFYADGSPVREGDSCTEDEAMGMFRHALQVFEDAVKRLVTVPLNSNQFSALVAFCYNVGEANLASSTVLKETNAGRFDDAAAAFGMWVFATLDGYKQALRGLLRRRYAEASLFLGYDWVEACADEAIALQREKPASLPGKDRVIYKTPFKDVLRVAQRYPLPPATQPAPEAKPAPAVIPDSARAIPDTPAAPASPVASAGAQGSVKPPAPTAPAPPAPQTPAAPAVVPSPVATGRAVESKAAPTVPPPPVKPKAPVAITTRTIDPNAIDYGAVDIEKGAKNMTDSRRFVGLLVVGAGSLTQVVATRYAVSNVLAGVFYDLSRDPIVVSLIAAGVIWFIGSIGKFGGRKTTTKGMIEAEYALK